MKKQDASKGETKDRKKSRRPSERSLDMQLRSIDLMLEEQNPLQVEIVGTSSVTPLGSVASASAPPRPPPSRKTPSGPASLPRPADPKAFYVDEGLLARGGMSSIRKVVDKRLRRTVAMKVLSNAEEPGSAPSRRFLDEAQVTGQLDHPNIVPIYELAVDANGTPSFFTMKIVSGRHLGELIEELGPDRLEARNLERLVQLVLKACEAVSFAHSHGVIHRDLKPANVMVGSHGQVYVMDWGLALLRTGRSVTQDEEEHHAIGTPAFMAPEQARARITSIDERTDVFGLGGILYVILTGRPPFQAGTPVGAVELAQKGKVKDPAKLESERPVPPELCRIAMKALSKRRADRYESVAALQADLEQFLRGGGWLETRVFAPGKRIIRQGDEAEEAFIVVSGTCEAFHVVKGKRVPLRRMGPGEVFGETVFLANRERMASVSAVDEVTLKVITREALERELEGSAWVRSFVTVLAERFRDVATELAELRRKQRPIRR